MSYATLRRLGANGEVNKLLPADQAVHGWYRFVLSFPPHLVRDYLQRFGIGANEQVLDPFCGTGTTLVECRKTGVACVGVEAHPLAYFASTVKLNWSPDSEGLVKHASRVAERASAILASQGIEDLPLFRHATTEYPGLRRLSEEAEKLLLRNSISPLPLHKVLVLLEALDSCRDDRYHKHELLALAKALSTTIGNLHFGPEVGVGEIKPDAPALSLWLGEVRNIAHDLRNLEGGHSTPATVSNSDARELDKLLEPESISAVITSPPYPNEKDYTRTMRLESVILGFIQSKADLQTLKRRLVRSNTRGVYKGDDDDLWVAGSAEIQAIAEQIEARRVELKKTSGFEKHYATVTKLYFGGMAKHLANLRPLLRPGAQLAYVVGDQASYLRVMIRTGGIFGRIARSLGYEVTGTDLFRTRLATATGEQLREEVVRLRWPGT